MDCGLLVFLGVGLLTIFFGIGLAEVFFGIGFSEAFLGGCGLFFEGFGFLV
ncbi:hypothetical protein [Thermosulfurimonas dismutans]|uniref:Uncharacterized protein n=1 Tax=Thermosulfurimonas dismutans TaxID=999894 RepID=A0A179D2W7_9BACT|nr:hypothetical protein [Thermosulfurimonas dismutans]OAQ20059.1 hypothetical protein TDIS_1878 [Thermosulfurimonas dismutans]